MNDRIARLESEASRLNVTRSARRDGVYQAAGAVAMVIGFVVSFAAYQSSLGTDDPRDIQSLVILSIAMLIVAVAGAVVFLRYSLARFLRFWLLRQLLEGQAHIDQLVTALAPGTTPPPTVAGETAANSHVEPEAEPDGAATVGPRRT
jgi:hypothetical protein